MPYRGSTSDLDMQRSISWALSSAIAPWVDGERVNGRPRPSWWRPFARRKWDRAVERALREEVVRLRRTTNRVVVFVPPNQRSRWR
jgi:hypothetical protein